MLPIVVSTFVILPPAVDAPLVGCLMFGNLLRECGVTDRLSEHRADALMNIVTNLPVHLRRRDDGWRRISSTSTPSR